MYGFHNRHGSQHDVCYRQNYPSIHKLVLLLCNVILLLLCQLIVLPRTYSPHFISLFFSILLHHNSMYLHIARIFFLEAFLQTACTHRKRKKKKTIARYIPYMYDTGGRSRCEVGRGGESYNSWRHSRSPAVRRPASFLEASARRTSYGGSGGLGAGAWCRVDRRAGTGGEKER